MGAEVVERVLSGTLEAVLDRVKKKISLDLLSRVLADLHQVRFRTPSFRCDRQHDQHSPGLRAFRAAIPMPAC